MGVHSRFAPEKALLLVFENGIAKACEPLSIGSSDSVLDPIGKVNDTLPSGRVSGFF